MENPPVQSLPSTAQIFESHVLLCAKELLSDYQKMLTCRLQGAEALRFDLGRQIIDHTDNIDEKKRRFDELYNPARGLIEAKSFIAAWDDFVDEVRKRSANFIAGVDTLIREDAEARAKGAGT